MLLPAFCLCAITYVFCSVYHHHAVIIHFYRSSSTSLPTNSVSLIRHFSSPVPLPTGTAAATVPTQDGGLLPRHHQTALPPACLSYHLTTTHTGCLHILTTVTWDCSTTHTHLQPVSSGATTAFPTCSGYHLSPPYLFFYHFLGGGRFLPVLWLGGRLWAGTPAPIYTTTISTTCSPWADYCAVSLPGTDRGHLPPPTTWEQHTRISFCPYRTTCTRWASGSACISTCHTCHATPPFQLLPHPACACFLVSVFELLFPLHTLHLRSAVPVWFPSAWIDWGMDQEGCQFFWAVHPQTVDSYTTYIDLPGILHLPPFLRFPHYLFFY